MEILKSLLKDPKVANSIGVFILALALAFILYKVLTNDLAHLNATLLKVGENIDRNTEVISGLNGTLQANTKAIEYLQRK